MTEIMDVDTEPVKTAQTQAPGSEPTGWMSPTGEIREGAPENVRTLLEAKKWDNINQIVDGYGELEKLVGVGEHLVIPKVDDPEFATKMGDVFNRLGRPDTHDKYEYEYDGDVEISDELTGQFKEYAHSLGLTQDQFNKIVNFQLDAVAAQSQAYTEQAETQKQENISALQLKWGANYETKIKGAKIIADSLGIYQTLETKGLASDPVIIEMLDTIASRTSEDVITPVAPSTLTKTPQERLVEIKKSESFLKRFHPDHKKIMIEFMDINQQIANAGQARQPRL